ncbi:hypothetical protein SLEP1_g34171 [Rubroshorea leprosula]|uniref:Uncharacterized protein n=1 Tax=Rubroshorea leprosula TaxID=152421 RepID=A0AAV5KJ60_9ROSI|nr:hypothetical protein SLEP1_g34171 [Rubroshorea leprosula]
MGNHNQNKTNPPFVILLNLAISEFEPQTMAGSKKIDTDPGAARTSLLESDPPEQTDSVDIFENQDLQEELSLICNKVPRSFSDQMFLKTSDSLILGPVFTSTPPSNLHVLYPQPHRHFFPFKLEPDWEP